ncbi:phosphoglycerate kinase [Moraxella sp. FZFQ2102]|uniref:phosphoglycerate kinase n=1 Tax=Moraxella sp. FZFQ2102 TaxID=2953752 RepID=UPI00209C1F35|nr:phosphoglycerate kinase [Moraxella sp. FZFQ2102]USZ14921.1 phosphoglycerate kinase [Moraxella sp. FZFQ2102]
MSIVAMKDLDLAAKRVLIREDLNVPIKDGVITSDVRLQAALPTLKDALAQGAAVLVASHLGRPTEGEPEAKYSLAPVAEYLAKHLDAKVRFETDYLNGVEVATGELVLLENVRFNVGEKKNSQELSERYANLCDVFVMDAFGTAHRAQASTEGVIRAAAAQGKAVCSGNLLTEELNALSRALDNPAAPVLAIVGGSKVSTKLDVLLSLADKCDSIVVGGGIANTFLAATGVNVGASLYEPDLIDTAKEIMSKTQILLPNEVVVADKSQIDFEDFLGSLAKADTVVKSVADIGDNDMILDISENSANIIADHIKNAATILWNGPVGVFEVDKFGTGTKILSLAVKDSAGFSIAGGGDTLAAIDKYQVADDVSYLSTGGGAFLEFVEGKTLPAIAALEQSNN